MCIEGEDKYYALNMSRNTPKVLYERDGVDGWTGYFRNHASISTLSCSHLYIVPSGSRPKHLPTRPKAEFTDGMDGWVSNVSFIFFHFLFGVQAEASTNEAKGRVYYWMDTMDGWMGYQKCPSIFFILLTYIEHVNIY